MKKLNIYAISASIIIFSILVGMFTASKIMKIQYDKYWEEFEAVKKSHAALFDKGYDQEFTITTAIGNIELILDNEKKRFYEINCTILRLQNSQLKPELVKDIERKEKLIKLLDKSKKLLERLKKEKFCITTDSS